ncbi:hypothetical protein JW851_00740, partial [Candidatus Woesearchaeota archaeon]|nr:hypothetical protein [Candidatus Woesearchaeota archaeon]
RACGTGGHPFDRIGIFAGLKKAATAKKQKGAVRLKTAPKSENKTTTTLHQIRDKPARVSIY